MSQVNTPKCVNYFSLEKEKGCKLPWITQPRKEAYTHARSRLLRGHPSTPVARDQAASGEDLIPWTRNLLKHLLETCVEEELEVYLRAARHERTVDRHDYRNGAYARDLITELGLLRALRVPPARTAGFQPQVFPRYQRRPPGVTQLLQTAFIRGVNTASGAAHRPLPGGGRQREHRLPADGVTFKSTDGGTRWKRQ